MDPKIDPALLEKLREASGLRLDREGGFWHQGEPIEHARTLAVLHRGIHRAPDGRWATRIGAEWGYLDVEDAAFFVRRVEIAGETLRAQLADGAWTELAAAALAESAGITLGAGDALYLRVNGERARLTRAAQLSLSEAVRELPGGTFALLLGDRLVAIGADKGPEPRR